MGYTLEPKLAVLKIIREMLHNSLVWTVYLLEHPARVRKK